MKNNNKENCNDLSKNNTIPSLCKIKIKKKISKTTEINKLKYKENKNKYYIFNENKENIDLNVDTIMNVKTNIKKIENTPIDSEKQNNKKNLLKEDYKTKILFNISERVKYGIDDSGNPVIVQDYLSKEGNEKKLVCYIIENKDKNLKNYLVDIKGNIINAKNNEGDYCYQDDNIYLIIKDFDVQHPQLRIYGHTNFNYENTENKKESIDQNNETQKNITKINENTNDIKNENEMMLIWRQRYGEEKKTLMNEMKNISKTERAAHDIKNNLNKTDFISNNQFNNDFYLSSNTENNVNTNENNKNNNNAIINLNNNDSKNQFFVKCTEIFAESKNKINPLISKRSKSLIKSRPNINNPLIKIHHFNTNNIIQIKTKINPQKKIVKKRYFTFIDPNYQQIKRKSSLNFINNNKIPFSYRNDKPSVRKNHIKIPKGNIKCCVLSKEANQMINNLIQKIKKIN